MATIEKKSAIVLPTSIIKGIMCAVDTDNKSYRPMLKAFVIKGRAANIADGRRYDLTIAACDSFELVELLYSYDLTKGEPIDTPDEFEWVIKPTDKITGSDPYIRIERIEDEQGRVSYNVRTYKSSARSTAIARGMAIADSQPTSYHVWETVEGTFPHYEKLFPAKLTTIGNVTVNPDVYGKVEKALTTAFDPKYGITLCGANANATDARHGLALEYAMRDNDSRTVARAIVMSMVEKEAPDMGNVKCDGIDPAEHKALQERYDAQLEINQKLSNEAHELRLKVHALENADFDGVSSDEYGAMELAYEGKCKQCEELAALVAELNEKLAAKEGENAELRSAWEELCKYAYDKGAAVPESQVEVVEPDEIEPEPQPEPTPTLKPQPEPTPEPTPEHPKFWVPNGCTESEPTKAKNVWLKGPMDLIEAHEAELIAAGWKLAKQRKERGIAYMWRKAC